MTEEGSGGVMEDDRLGLEKLRSNLQVKSESKTPVGSEVEEVVRQGCEGGWRGKNRGESGRKEEDGSNTSSPCVTGLRGQHSQVGPN